MRFVVLFLLVFIGHPPQAGASLHHIEGKAQGSTWHVSYGDKHRPELRVWIEQELAALDKIFSNYRPDSDISRFNKQTSTDWFPVDEKLVTLVDDAALISRKSQGALDITIGPLLRVWGFGPFKTNNHTIPSATAIAEAKLDVDYRKLLSRKHPPALKKLNPRLYVDLSGIAQGYSVDRLALLLDKKGVTPYLVEIGGELRTKGVKSPGQPWTLGVDAPAATAGEVAAVLHIEDRALTTAGDYRDYFEQNGKRYSHTIDPRTGHPVQHHLASVTVIAPTACEADGWDTALMVLGPDASRKLLPELKNLAAYLILRDGSGFRTESLGGFERYLVPGRQH